MLFFGIETYLDNNQRTVQEVDSAAIAKTQETKMQSKLIENLKTWYSDEVFSLVP